MLPIPSHEERTTAVPKLGIGLAYQSQLRQFIERNRDAFDFLEVVPDILWTDLGRDAQPRYIEDSEGISFLEQTASQMSVIPHSIGLSIGSAHLFDRAHVAQLERWYEWLRFPWHSDHLSYHLAAAEHGSEDLHLNLTMPVALDHDTVEMIADRILEIRMRIPVPFLLENNVYYFVLENQELDEASFLNTLSESSACGILLDLHNLHVNFRNHGMDPYSFLDGLRLDRVLELHIAGGMEVEGMYVDAHSGPSPEPVWELLDWVLPRCPNLGGVTFELFGSWFEPTGENRLLAELDRMRELWSRHQPAPERPRA